MKRKRMKLFVWEDVLCDWTCGMIVALSPDLETAINSMADDKFVQEEMRRNEPESVIELGLMEPQTLVWYSYGGS